MVETSVKNKKHFWRNFAIQTTQKYIKLNNKPSWASLWEREVNIKTVAHLIREKKRKWKL